ncbi:hypothetical protein [Mucilaginibacter sp.]|uniref:OB-fold protein n=1 Tax=Mucilaginibacter sp. TaxID=1882438 RepID=UPI0025DF0E05|nr:hypothetical protein [Mucilaginibacter sp.]
MKIKIVLILLALCFTSVATVWYYVFQYSKTHHRDVESENAISVTAGQLVKDYQANESSANTRYLNKVIQIKGDVIKEGKDQAGNYTVTLKSNDPFSGVLCTLKNGSKINSTHSTIVVKGICAGFLTDVVLNEGVIVK